MRAPLLILFLASGCQALAPESALPQPADSNLLEYGCGHFGERDLGEAVPDLSPPVLKLYQDGALVVQTDAGLEARKLSPNHLVQLRQRVEQEMEEGSPGRTDAGRKPLLMHGGLCYVLLGAGEREVLRVFEGTPGGSIGRLLDRVQRVNSMVRRRFVPEQAVVEVEATPPLGTDRAWPFSETYDLGKLQMVSLFTLDDRQVLEFLFDRPVGRLWRVQQEGQSFLIRLRRVEGWYAPRALEQRIEVLVSPPPFVDR